MTPSPMTQALEAPIEAHATELKLPTVKRRFRQLAAEATASNRHLSPISPRCSGPRWSNAPSSARRDG